MQFDSVNHEPFVFYYYIVCAILFRKPSVLKWAERYSWRMRRYCCLAAILTPRYCSRTLRKEELSGGKNVQLIMSYRNGNTRVYIGDLGSGGSKPELEREFERYGPLKSVWVARNPPGKFFPLTCL